MRKLVDEMDIRDLNPGTEVVLVRRLTGGEEDHRRAERRAGCA